MKKEINKWKILRSYEELTIEEMQDVLGQGDTTAETTPVCAFTIASSVACGDAAFAAITIVTIKIL